MGNWKVLQIKITAESKIHLGNSQLGMVELTKRYIPGSALWGALTASITRMKMEEYNYKEYVEVGHYLKEYMRFTNCYVVETQSGANETILLPAYSENGLQYEKIKLNGKRLKDKTRKELDFISDYLFEKKYIRSYTSTALDYETNSSEDNALHEIEYIKSGTSFVGYIIYKPEELLQKGITQEHLETALTQYVGLQGIGGNRSRGFGKVKISLYKDQSSKTKEKESYSAFYKKDYRLSSVIFDLSSEKGVIVSLSKGLNTTIFPIVYRSKINFGNFLNFRGNILPIVSKQWNEKGAGQSISKVECVIMPGSTFSLNTDQDLILSSEGFLDIEEV